MRAITRLYCFHCILSVENTNLAAGPWMLCLLNNISVAHLGASMLCIWNPSFNGIAGTIILIIDREPADVR